MIINIDHHSSPFWILKSPLRNVQYNIYIYIYVQYKVVDPNSSKFNHPETATFRGKLE